MTTMRTADSHIHFIADEVAAVTELGVLTCGAATSQSNDGGHYFTIQANLEEPDDWGVYFEIDDQINGGYQRIRRVQLDGSQLKLTLAEGTDWYPDLEQITVDLSAIESTDVESLLVALNKCLAQCELEVEVATSK